MLLELASRPTVVAAARRRPRATRRCLEAASLGPNANTRSRSSSTPPGRSIDATRSTATPSRNRAGGATHGVSTRSRPAIRCARSSGSPPARTRDSPTPSRTAFSSMTASISAETSTATTRAQLAAAASASVPVPAPRSTSVLSGSRPSARSSDTSSLASYPALRSYAATYAASRCSGPARPISSMRFHTCDSMCERLYPCTRIGPAGRARSRCLPRWARQGSLPRRRRTTRLPEGIPPRRRSCRRSMSCSSPAGVPAWAAPPVDLSAARVATGDRDTRPRWSSRTAAARDGVSASPPATPRCSGGAPPPREPARPSRVAWSSPDPGRVWLLARATGAATHLVVSLADGRRVPVPLDHGVALAPSADHAPGRPAGVGRGDRSPGRHDRAPQAGLDGRELARAVASAVAAEASDEGPDEEAAPSPSGAVRRHAIATPGGVFLEIWGSRPSALLSTSFRPTRARPVAGSTSRPDVPCA